MRHKELTHIYTLSCPDTGLVRYVGKSDNPQKRFQRHTELCNDEKSHKVSWIKGLVNQGKKPVMDIIDTVPWCDWKMWEKKHIQLYKSMGAKLVNSTEGGDGGMTLESRRKLSDKFKGKQFLSKDQQKKNIEKLIAHNKINGVWNKGKGGYKSTISDKNRIARNLKSIGKHGGKPVLQYDLEGNFIKEWATAYAIYKELNVSFKLISACCKKKANCVGFLWRFKEEDVPLKIAPANLKTVKGKSVQQFDLNEKLIAEFSSPKEAQEKTGFNLKGISFSCTKENKTYKGFKWRYN